MNYDTFIRQLPVGEILPQVNRSLQAVPRLVVTAPPGAGKSTLLPLSLLEEIPQGKILMLEPRRIAARQIAERMAFMRGERVGETVGYRVRFENRVSEKTRIEVLTEGILTRMLVEDPTLEGVAMVIFDEFHERSIATDTALALTRETAQLLRPDLKILLMSATINTSALCRALDAPLLESEGRMFPVTILHEEESDPAHCAAAVASVIRKAHREQSGDILAFLPGQAEIMACKELLEGVWEHTAICPLYGLMQPEAQRRAIRPSAEGERKVVLATSIAETSLTIEGVRTVVDAGFCRKMVFDVHTGLSRMETVRISLDMARQRSGRAGRLSQGVCYRLWSKATEHRMSECRLPEIMEADLAPVVLEVAAWGEADLYRLPWLTPPPQAHHAHAQQLLRMLQAIDDKGRITSHGKRLSSLPCHPRMAAMLLSEAREETQALAADLAALLEERDPLYDSGDADMNSRIERLRSLRGRKGKEGLSGRWINIERIAEQYRRLVWVKEVNTIPSPFTTGELIASAYPERIAQTYANGKYRMASGEVVLLEESDDLSACPLLAVASVGNRIFLAAPLDKEWLTQRAHWRESIYWDSKQGRLVDRRELRVGALLLESRPLEGNASAKGVEVMAEAAIKEGTSMFDFNDRVTQLQQRLASVSSWHPELDLPDSSTEGVLRQASEWLPLYAGKATTTAELKKIDLCEVIWGTLSYEQQIAVERIAPTHIQVPTGSRIRVDYRQGAEAPVLSVRLQECFGMADTPCVDEGRRPVLMELLSPGFKPVQLTQDLHSFWQGTYFEVRKELRRRYPKHSWPEQPMEAPAVRGVKRRE